MRLFPQQLTMATRSLKMNAGSDGDHAATSAHRRGAIGRIAVREIFLIVILDVVDRRGSLTDHGGDAIGVPDRNSHRAGGLVISAHPRGMIGVTLIIEGARRTGMDIIITPVTKVPAAALVRMDHHIVDNRRKKWFNCSTTCEAKSRSSVVRFMHCEPAPAVRPQAAAQVRPAALRPVRAAEVHPVAVPEVVSLPAAGAAPDVARAVARKVAGETGQGSDRVDSEVPRGVVGPRRKCRTRDAKIPVAIIPVVNHVARKVRPSAARALTARRALVLTTLRR
jgi:hypothetical protein